MLIRANPRTLYWRSPDGRAGSFRPNEKMAVFTRAQVNPIQWRSEDTLAGRLIVGFNVRGVPTWSVDQIVGLVKKERERQAPADPGATFVAQKGIYKHKVSGEIIDEDGVQIIIIDTQGLKHMEFEAHMVELAEIIARKFEQEEVIVEIQRNGLTLGTMGVVA